MTNGGSRKKYKALLTDVDGTLVSVQERAMPSQTVITALEKASISVSIHLITARPFTDTHNLPNIFKALPFLSDCVINGGAQIINPRTQKITANKTMHKLSSFYTKLLLNICPEVIAITSGNKSFPLKDFSSSEDVIKVVAVGVNDKYIPVLMTQLGMLDDIVAYETTSYKQGKDIIITHKDATKAQAVKILMEKYKLIKEKMIGIGDTTHDLSFLHQCGTKVAMGNAQQEVKDVADFIAPSVDEDGLATVIEKYLC